MRQGRRYGLSAGQKSEIWRRWKAGESLHEIGRVFGKDHGSIQFLLSQHGANGISETAIELAEKPALPAQEFSKPIKYQSERPRQSKHA